MNPTAPLEKEQEKEKHSRPPAQDTAVPTLWTLFSPLGGPGLWASS